MVIQLTDTDSYFSCLYILVGIVTGVHLVSLHGSKWNNKPCTVLDTVQKYVPRPFSDRIKVMHVLSLTACVGSEVGYKY
jgi:hypothetical protein